MRRMTRLFLVAGIALPLIVIGGDAFGQVPAHPPGTICFTYQNVWCWASPPGPPGSDCVCPSPDGMLPGQLG